MNFQTIASTLSTTPIFESSSLYQFMDRPQQTQRQLSDWVRDGKVVQLRRGVYALAKPYRHVQPHPFAVANKVMQESYVSLQMALSYYGLIPDYVAQVTCVTTGRSSHYETPLGTFSYRHIQPPFFTGFRHEQVSESAWAYLATPEKALLDLIYLTPDGDDVAYLRSLRLQNLDQLDLNCLAQLVATMGKPKLRRAMTTIRALVAEDEEMYTPL